jgi:hypothetical protein
MQQLTRAPWTREPAGPLKTPMFVIEPVEMEATSGQVTPLDVSSLGNKARRQPSFHPVGQTRKPQFNRTFAMSVIAEERATENVAREPHASGHVFGHQRIPHDHDPNEISPVYSSQTDLTSPRSARTLTVKTWSSVSRPHALGENNAKSESRQRDQRGVRRPSLYHPMNGR